MGPTGGRVGEHTEENNRACHNCECAKMCRKKEEKKEGEEEKFDQLNILDII